MTRTLVLAAIAALVAAAVLALGWSLSAQIVSDDNYETPLLAFVRYPGPPLFDDAKGTTDLACRAPIDVAFDQAGYGSNYTLLVDGQAVPLGAPTPIDKFWGWLTYRWSGIQLSPGAHTIEVSVTVGGVVKTSKRWTVWVVAPAPTGALPAAPMRVTIVP